MRTPSKNTKARLTATAATAALAVGLTACGTASDPQSAGSGTQDGPLTVAASATPHAEILEYVRDHLAEEEGLELNVKVFNDYVLPNTATESGDVDANYFQHQPYLDDFNAKNGTHIVPVTTVHLEPLGLYAKDARSLDDLTPGQTIALPNDTTNGGRALRLLDANGVIELKDGAGQDATLADIADPRGLKFQELEAATLPRALGEVDAAVINGNYAIEADLKPAEDALALEEADGNPYANFLAVKEGDEDDPRVATLARLLNSEQVRSFIKDEYDGSVLPASGGTTV
ncbi:MetQ/NlpA family ABC transporter substrate-binding protein [Streptomyces sp. JJ66]|uniref:MetQ/NlpA family ABC transporter substrate-binding protein n=1 Tax=Streptomyces sp. JJ66 TaxID=2803843 RepID=UPI001C579F63|nr:MetQ/NlpA family ABC transporter substrate-binding protein [Streptomyces sp. JJ66]MBW1604099.1 MetQ/NlpA family ABC transporter substrate-binding protein [Streptomyces sp. JJ66]